MYTSVVYHIYYNNVAYYYVYIMVCAILFKVLLDNKPFLAELPWCPVSQRSIVLASGLIPYACYKVLLKGTVWS